MYELKKRLWVDANGKATADPQKGVRLIGAPGHRITDDEADRYGIAAAESRKVKVEKPDTGLPAGVRHLVLGWYELPDGSRVHGKRKAIEAAAALEPADDELTLDQGDQDNAKE